MDSFSTTLQKESVRYIVAAVDLQHAAEFTVRNATVLARAFGARLDVVHSIPTGAFPSVDHGGEAEQVMLDDHVQGWCERELEALVREVAPVEVEVHPVVVRGRPSVAVAEYAEEQGADLIVVASEGRRGLKRLIFGSTAESLLRQTDVATLVLTVPEQGGADLVTDPHAVAAR